MQNINKTKNSFFLPTQTKNLEKLQKCGKRMRHDFGFFFSSPNKCSQGYLFWLGFDPLDGAFLKLVSTDFSDSFTAPFNFFRSAGAKVTETRNLLG